MALIENLEREGWDRFFADTFRYVLDVLQNDRHRPVGSSADDLRSWLAVGGVARVRERLNSQMEVRQFPPARKAAVNDCLEQLVRENRAALLDLVFRGVVPGSGQDWLEACGVSELDVSALLSRIVAGERPFEEWMRAHGHSEEEIAEIYTTIDRWLMQRGVIPPRPLFSSN